MAPSGPFGREAFEAGVSVIARRYRPAFTEGIYATQRYLAGDDARRLAELSAALGDPSVRAVFCARGGYGAMRLLRKLDLRSTGPKLLVGFSDVTALHLAAQAAGWITVHGPVLTQLGQQPAEVVSRLVDLLEKPAPSAPLTGTDTILPGRVEGPLLGGNLSVLTRLLGTPFLPALEGAVLLVEDVGERPYRLDRMWTHLALAGVFDRIAGLVLGDFTSCEEPDATFSAREVLVDLARETGLPCAAGFPIGHGAVNQPVPLGARVRLDASARRLDFLEAAVEAPAPSTAAEPA